MSSQTVAPRKPKGPYPQFQGNPMATAPSADAVAASGAGSAAFWVSAAYTFLVFSRTVEFIDNTGRMHLSLISGLLSIAAVLATGSIPKMLLSKPGKWLALFSFWLFIGLPFSTWKGGSTAFFESVWLKSYLTFFIVGGLIFTLKQLRTTTVIFALGTASQVYLAYRHGLNQEDDRMAATYGSLGNANDLASALLIGTPFILFAIADKKVNAFLRLCCIPLLGMILVLVLKTGSRGGLVAIAVLLLFSFFKASAGGKMKIAVTGFVIIALFAAVVPSSLRSRYMTIFQTDRASATTAGSQSALDSSNARRELFRNAFILTFRHPVFGVGLGQFSVQSFNLFVSRGITGMWFTCHDIFGLVMSELGIPALIFFCAVLVSSVKILSRLAKLPRTTPELDLIARLAYTLLMSLVAFIACGIFNTQAYGFQLPVLASLAAALDRIAAPYIALGAPAEAPKMPAAYVNRRLAERTVQAAS